MQDSLTIGDPRDRAFKHDDGTDFVRHDAQLRNARFASAGEPLEFARMRQADDPLTPRDGENGRLQRIRVEH